jgi:hypothetical protein
VPASYDRRPVPNNNKGVELQLAAKIDDTKQKEMDNNFNVVSKPQISMFSRNKEQGSGSDDEKNVCTKAAETINTVDTINIGNSRLNEHDDEHDGEPTVAQAPPLSRQVHLSLPGAFAVRHPNAQGEIDDDEERGGNLESDSVCNHSADATSIFIVPTALLVEENVDSGVLVEACPCDDNTDGGDRDDRARISSSSKIWKDPAVANRKRILLSLILVVLLLAAALVTTLVLVTRNAARAQPPPPRPPPAQPNDEIYSSINSVRTNPVSPESGNSDDGERYRGGDSPNREEDTKNNANEGRYGYDSNAEEHNGEYVTTPDEYSQDGGDGLRKARKD